LARSIGDPHLNGQAAIEQKLVLFEHHLDRNLRRAPQNGSQKQTQGQWKNFHSTSLSSPLREASRKSACKQLATNRHFPIKRVEKFS
jgi:hypothetical protein